MAVDGGARTRTRPWASDPAARVLPWACWLLCRAEPGWDLEGPSPPSPPPPPPGPTLGPKRVPGAFHILTHVVTNHDFEAGTVIVSISQVRRSRYPRIKKSLHRLSPPKKSFLSPSLWDPQEMSRAGLRGGLEAQRRLGKRQLWTQRSNLGVPLKPCLGVCSQSHRGQGSQDMTHGRAGRGTCLGSDSQGPSVLLEDWRAAPWGAEWPSGGWEGRAGERGMPRPRERPSGVLRDPVGPKCDN